MNTICPFCLTEDISVVLSLYCGHQFCLACIGKWYDSNKKGCPLCNHPISSCNISKALTYYHSYNETTNDIYWADNIGHKLIESITITVNDNYSEEHNPTTTNDIGWDDYIGDELIDEEYNPIDIVSLLSQDPTTRFMYSEYTYEHYIGDICEQALQYYEDDDDTLNEMETID